MSYDFESDARQYCKIVQSKIESYEKDILKLFDLLERGKEGESYTKDNKFIYNDLDNKIWINDIRESEYKAFCFEDQNVRYITFILKFSDNNPFGKILVFRFWDEYYKGGLTDSENNHQDLELNDKITVRQAIKSADWMKECFSDELEGNQYIQRPSLRYFEQNMLVEIEKNCFIILEVDY